MVYDYECPACGKEFEGFNFIANRHHSECPKCGEQANKVFHPSASRTLFFRFDEYVDEHISKDGNPVMITSRKERKQIADKNGVYIKN